MNIIQENELLVPKRVTFETIYGCNLSCTMCVIDNTTDRKKGLMPMDLFYKAVDDLVPYKDQIELFDFFVLGEPLLDPHLFDRINYVREKGFKNLGFSTNVDLLDAVKQKKLLDTGIDTIIFSIDGATKETHEKIRIRSNFERVVKNAQDIIKMRNEGNYKTRFVVRFIRMDENKHEFSEYKNFWEANISRERNDFITAHDTHSWAGDWSSKTAMLGDIPIVPEIEAEPCHHVLDNLVILADGTVPLCFEDPLGKVKFGNVKDMSPIEIFNNSKRLKYRELHLSGRKNEIKKCSECTVLYMEKTKETF